MVVISLSHQLHQVKQISTLMRKIEHLNRGYWVIVMSIEIYTFQIMMNIKDFSKSIKNKVPSDERFFRLMVYHFITKGRSVLLYDEDKFKEYIMTIEVEGTDMYKFLILRRHEFMSNVEGILLRGLTETRN